MWRFNSPLDQIRVAAPCHVEWDSMFGNERIRFCGQCQLNVYNLSELTRAEAEALISRTEGRLCVRYYQRFDGSIITRNCPIGLKAIKKRLSRIATAAASAVLSFFAGLGAYGIADRFSLVSTTPVTMMGAIAIETPTERSPQGINKTQVTPTLLADRVVVGKLLPVKLADPVHKLRGDRSR